MAELANSLAVERARLAAIPDNLPVGVWVADQNGRIIQKNKAADIIWSGDAPLCKSIDEYTEYVAWYADSGKRLSLKDYPFVKVLQTGHPTEPVELTIRRFDGSSRVIRAYAAPITDERGQMHGLVGINVDITDRKQMEDELRRHKENLEGLVKERTRELKHSERAYRMLVENIPTYIVQYGTDFRIRYVSPQGLRDFGYDSAIIGKTLPEIGIPQEYCELFHRHMTEALQSGTAVVFEVQFPDKQGAVRDMLNQITPEYNENGRIESLLSIVQDITDRKKTEADLLRLDRLNTVGEIAAAIGHEVRNPLTTVRGYLQIMQRKKEYTEHGEQLSIMIDELDRANAIISDYLSLAKNKIAEFKRGSLNDLLTAFFPLLQADALLSGCSVELKTSPLPDINFDEKELRQLVLNLTRNALEASPAGGTVTISTSFEGGRVILALQDTGRGIPKHIIKKIGTPFLTTKENGTGLGLSVCYRIAERHHAKIDVNSSHEGTTFFIKFPV
ncbi:MAG: PAS domain S-box protein [Sporomusaceae bacterium]|nr:PAS domain S-box protein [Sporomusaceae bacterium]